MLFNTDCLILSLPQEISQDSFSSQSSAPPSNQPKSVSEDVSMQGQLSSLPVSPHPTCAKVYYTSINQIITLF